MKRVNAGELQRQVNEEGLPLLEHLLFLGQACQSPFILGLSHLFSAYPKTGKTDLLAQLVAEWSAAGLKVLYLTEEPELIWKARLNALPPGFDSVYLVFALGMTSKEIERAIKDGDDDVVVIDTIRMLGWKDEKDNAEIMRVMTPLIKLCREGKKTSIFAHHTRKGGGEHGEAASGGHALFGIVDVGLEITRVSGVNNRRTVKGIARVTLIPDLIYEMRGDGTMVFMGDPAALRLNGVKTRVTEVLTSEWQSAQEIKIALGSPRPSKDNLTNALNGLAIDGIIERDPVEGRPGATYHWRNLAPTG